MSSEEIYEYIGPAVVEIQVFDINGSQFALGSGFFIDAKGTLVTNYHVIEAAYSAKALLYDGSMADISYIKAYDTELDLAILQAEVTDTVYLELAEEPAKTGETVYALGSSEGLTGSFSAGIVSTASRDINGVDCIQTTAPISHGNSGGPLVDSYGDVLGVNAMTLDDGQNLNFAISIKELDKLDASGTLSFPDFYEETAPLSYSGEELTGYFYDELDLVEVESNDSILLADALYNGEWLAAEVTDIYDYDCFYIEVDGPCDVLFEVAPWWLSDMEYLGAAVMAIGDDDMEVLAVLEATEELTYTEELAAKVHFDEAGYYFLVVVIDDSYAEVYDEPVYYTVSATW